MRKGGGGSAETFCGVGFWGPCKGGGGRGRNPGIGGAAVPMGVLFGGEGCSETPPPIYPPQEDGKEVVEEPQKEEEAAAETEKAE